MQSSRSKRLKLTILIALVAFCTSALAARVEKKRSSSGRHRSVALPGPSYAHRSDVLAVAQQIAESQQLDPAWVRRTLAQANYLPSVAKAVVPPAIGFKKNWRVYRSRFVEPIRIQAGVRFWNSHTQDLARAQAETGVPMEIIVGIIGVETIYGQQMGSYRVLDALATLAFDFPASHPRASQRSAYFLSELGHFLRLMLDSHTEPGSPLGSYAGAMGLPQFMPSSVRRYAIDFDADGRTDLHGSAADAIGSVANYLSLFGWVRDLPTHYPVTLDQASLDMTTLMAPDILPSFSTAEFQAKGAILDRDAARHPGKLALIELQNGTEAPSYVAGTENFYAITRYNWSSYYAMAVIELGQAVMQARLQAAN